MKLDELAPRFRKSEEADRACAQTENLSADVVLAGTIAEVTREACCIDINGARYEISPADVSDVQLLSEAASGKPDDGAEITSAEVMLIKVKSNAVLVRRIPVQAARVAAEGVWVSIVPGSSHVSPTP